VLRNWNSGGASAEAGSIDPNDGATCPAITLQQTDGTDVLLQFFGVAHTTAGTPVWGAPPTGYTALTTGSKYTYSCYKQVTTTDGSAQITTNLIAQGAPANLGYRGAQGRIPLPLAPVLARHPVPAVL
jgi:hypothetical protein